MPKLRRQRLHRRFGTDAIPLRLRWTNGVAGSRRNPGREDRSTWNSCAFISPADVDGYIDETASDTEIDTLQQIMEDLSTGNIHDRRPMSVSLLEIARPAKAKGLAKEFELVKAPRRVIALEDDDVREYADDEDWEEIYFDEEPHDKRRTYSAVLRGHNMR